MSYIKSVLKWILHIVQQSENAICAVGLVACTFLVFAQVVNRYWLHFEIMWFGDLALYTFIFFMLLAGALTTWREGHVAVDYFREKAFTGKPRAMTIYRLCLVAISIALTGVIFSIAYKFMLRAVKYPEYGTLVRWFNTSWLHITLFVALGLVLVHLLVIARRDTNDLRKIWRAKSQE